MQTVCINKCHDIKYLAMTDKKRVGRPNKEAKLNKKQEVRCLDDDKKQWALAAELSDHKSTSDYIRDTMNKHSKRVINKSNS